MHIVGGLTPKKRVVVDIAASTLMRPKVEIPAAAHSKDGEPADTESGARVAAVGSA